MTTEEAVRFFDGKPSRLAEALHISPAAVSQWGDKIPMRRQYEIERLTKGKLKADRNHHAA